MENRSVADSNVTLDLSSRACPPLIPFDETGWGGRKLWDHQDINSLLGERLSGHITLPSNRGIFKVSMEPTDLEGKGAAWQV